MNQQGLDGAVIRQIPGGASPNESISDDRSGAGATRVVTGFQQITAPSCKFEFCWYFLKVKAMSN